ncbi:MAG: hypothetical protein R2839_04865 [Thermomicrobiales bacterium]
MCGSASGPRDLAWSTAAYSDFDRLQVRDVTSAWCALGVWGRRPSKSSAVSPMIRSASRISQIPGAIDDHRRYSCDGNPHVLCRRAGSGVAHLDRVWRGAFEALMAGGEAAGNVAAGGGAMDTLRLETGYRAWAPISAVTTRHTKRVSVLPSTIVAPTISVRQRWPVARSESD